MRKLWKKSPILLVLVIALFITSAALGAFLWLQGVEGSVVAQDMPEVFMMVRDCQITAGEGTIDTCEAQNGNFVWAVSDADDDLVLELTQNFQNQVDEKTFHFTPSADPSITAQSCTIGGNPCEGAILAVDEYNSWVITLEFGNLQPSDVISITDMAVSAESN